MKTTISLFYTCMVLCMTTINVYGQVSTPFNNGGGGEYVGWDNSIAIPLEIRHNRTVTPQNIDFYTNNTFRMTLSGANGFLGIGSGITTPAFQLEVADDINLIPGGFPNFGYRWDGEVILKTDIVGTNIFVGMNAGNNNFSISNTYVCFNAGNANASGGGGNTFVGCDAGYSLLN